MGFLAGQSSFQAQPATGGAQFTSQNLQPAITQAQGGYGTAQGRIGDVYGGQAALAAQLAAQAQGQGPNIAQLQLQQATNQNIQQGAGMIGSQRGMNPALAARLIAQQTANANQNAAGQSGLMRAQQQLAAQSALSNVYGQQGNLAATGGQLANQNLGLNQSALQFQNADIIGAKQAADKINAETAASNAAGLGKLAQGVLGGVGTALSGPLGSLFSSNPISGAAAAGTGNAAAATGAYDDRAVNMNATAADGGQIVEDSSGSTAAVPPPENWSKGARSLSDAFKSQGGEMHDYKSGGNVPGQAAHPGNNPKNDVVPAMLSKGEVVLPNTVTKAADAPDKAKAFMQAIMDQKKTGPKGFSKILELKHKVKEMHGHLSDLHDMMEKAQ
jgi:hypothetical protein